MPVCQKCNCTFPNRLKDENGKVHHLQRRKYCTNCSPIGLHNTGQLHKDDQFEYAKTEKNIHNCKKCGETDPSKFYGNKKSICGKCHNEYTIKLGQEKRRYAIDKLGGKCAICGYAKYIGAIDIHHLDSSLKDEQFRQLRSWSLERIDKEIQNCVALCRVCHSEVHAGITEIGQ